MNISPAQVWRTRLEHYRLIGGYCSKCAKYFYPPRPACPYCGSRSVSRVELPKRGRVITYTVIYNVISGFRAYAPLILAVIELDNGARVLAQLTDTSPEEVEVGMPVEAVLRRVVADGDKGVIVYAVKFRPLRFSEKVEQG